MIMEMAQGVGWRGVDSADVLSTQSTRDPDVVNGMSESMNCAAPRQPISREKRQKERPGIKYLDGVDWCAQVQVQFKDERLWGCSRRECGIKRSSEFSPTS